MFGPGTCSLLKMWPEFSGIIRLQTKLLLLLTGLLYFHFVWTKLAFDCSHVLNKQILAWFILSDFQYQNMFTMQVLVRVCKSVHFKMYKPCMFEYQVLDQIEILVRFSFFTHLEVTDTNLPEQFPDYKWQDCKHGCTLEWVEGLRSGAGPRIFFSDSSVLLLPLQDAFEC